LVRGKKTIQLDDGPKNEDHVSKIKIKIKSLSEFQAILQWCLKKKNNSEKALSTTFCSISIKLEDLPKLNISSILEFISEKNIIEYQIDFVELQVNEQDNSKDGINGTILSINKIISDRKEGKIPQNYKDYMLTQILKQSFEKCSNIQLIACLNPDINKFDQCEYICSLFNRNNRNKTKVSNESIDLESDQIKKFV